MTSLISLLASSETLAKDNWIYPTQKGNFLVCPDNTAARSNFVPVSNDKLKYDDPNYYKGIVKTYIEKLYKLDKSGGIKNMGSVAYINNTPGMTRKTRQRLLLTILNRLEVPNLYKLTAWEIFPMEANDRNFLGNKYMYFKYENQEQKNLELIINDRAVGGRDTIVDSKGRRLAVELGNDTYTPARVYCFNNELRMAFVFDVKVMGEWSGKVTFNRYGSPEDYPSIITFKDEYEEEIEGPTLFFLHDINITTKQISPKTDEAKQSGFDF